MSHQVPPRVQNPLSLLKEWAVLESGPQKMLAILTFSLPSIAYCIQGGLGTAKVGIMGS
jgi:hypothetical protein